MKTINTVVQAWFVIIELKQRHLHTSTGNGRFALLGNAFAQIYRQIVPIRVKTVIKIGNINKRELNRRDTAPLLGMFTSVTHRTISSG